ncbi:MAG: type II secretion system protein GspC [Gammaproteobacteria bacterium]|nr:type II secretion system protein GspC [Gammaproteobacteria bacterium]MBL7000409.1 type II secretion system protein GspC [Gammaproteobacteria bacterium]
MQLDTLFKTLNDLRLIVFTTMAAVVMLAYQMSIMVWQIVPVPELDNASLSASTPSRQLEVQGPTVQQKTAQIAAQHLFGQVVKVSKVVSPVQVQDAPESSLSYKIRGIYYSTEKALSSVILQKDSNTTNFYRLGEEIDNGIYIEQINQDYILISRQGRLEKLLLEKPTADMKASFGSPQASLSSTSAAKVLQSYKRRYSDNPLALAKRFQAIPISENGKNIGYKLKSLRGESLLKKLDLHEDDVFVAINGIGLEKPFQALDALKSLTTAENVSITVLRNGNRETLDFTLN